MCYRRDNDCELVASQTCHHLIFVEQSGDAFGERLQYRVACGVPRDIVDFLESVEVQAQERKVVIAFAVQLQLLIQVGIEGAAVS